MTTQDHFESANCKGAFLPLLLLEISFALILIFQLATLLPQRDLLQQVIKQNEKGVEQSKQLQADFVKLATEFSEAAPEEAKAAFAKRGIQVGGIAPAPVGSPAATPAAKP
ncbi:MAG: hypothetical protein NTZ46_09415 [Verrucomicrobia bacterium]|nr:hypothetical protein [Verrucomicrobiota bacterium]